jgi:hypothetical protein
LLFKIDQLLFLFGRSLGDIRGDTITQDYEREKDAMVMAITYAEAD